ncbi:hypothetical protein [Cupriavidus sp. DL-D2]|uniref:hypothetical protein n=1 Tax=Cupriavidus sp. DL-D2 TaxID=3144974 RepID=UPI003215F0F3
MTTAFIKTAERYLVRIAEDPTPSPDETAIPMADDDFLEAGKWRWTGEDWEPGKLVWSSDLPGYVFVPE